MFAQHDSPTPVASRDVVASQTNKKIGIVFFKHDERIILIEYFLKLYTPLKLLRGSINTAPALSHLWHGKISNR